MFWKLLSRSRFQRFSALLFWELCVYWHLLSLCRISVFGDARGVFKPLVFKSYFLLGSRTDSPLAGKCGFRDASLDSNSWKRFSLITSCPTCQWINKGWMVWWKVCWDRNFNPGLLLVSPHSSHAIWKNYLNFLILIFLYSHL